MSTYYSILYTQLNAFSKERLNLGLVMISDNGDMKFRLSENKLNLIKNLFSKDSVSLMKSYFHSIQNKIAIKNELIEQFSEIKQEYLQYLSNYSNNLIAFSQPEKIQLDLTEETFNKVFEKFVFHQQEYRLKKPKRKSELNQFRNEFYSRVKKRANVNLELSSDKLDFVLFPTRVDMIGKNDRPVLNKFFDLSTRADLVRNKVNSYISLIKPFEISTKIDGKFFMVMDEPSKELKHQHETWKHLRSSSLTSKEIIEIVPTDETQKIEEYLERHEVQPYFVE